MPRKRKRDHEQHAKDEIEVAPEQQAEDEVEAPAKRAKKNQSCKKTAMYKKGCTEASCAVHRGAEKLKGLLGKSADFQRGYNETYDSLRAEIGEDQFQYNKGYTAGYDAGRRGYFKADVSEFDKFYQQGYEAGHVQAQAKITPEKRVINRASNNVHAAVNQGRTAIKKLSNEPDTYKKNCEEIFGKTKVKPISEQRDKRNKNNGYSDGFRAAMRGDSLPKFTAGRSTIYEKAYREAFYRTKLKLKREEIKKNRQALLAQGSQVEVNSDNLADVFDLDDVLSDFDDFSDSPNELINPSLSPQMAHSDVNFELDTGAGLFDDSNEMVTDFMQIDATPTSIVDLHGTFWQRRSSRFEAKASATAEPASEYVELSKSHVI